MTRGAMEVQEEKGRPEAKKKEEVKVTTVFLELFPTAVTEEKLEEAREKAITRIFGLSKNLQHVRNPNKVGTFEGILQSKIDDHCQEGQTYFCQGEWEKAIVCFTKALNLDSNKVELHKKKAEAYLQLCDFQSAAMHFGKVCRALPEDENIRTHLALIFHIQAESLYEQKVYLDALESFTYAVELQPQNTLYRMRSIACLAAINQFNNCLQMVNEELDREKKNPDLFVLRARLYEYFGKAGFCFVNIQEALALDPEHTEAQLMLKKLLYEAERSKDLAVNLAIKGSLQAALLKLNRAIDYNPLDANFFLLRGSILRRLKDFSAAVDDYLKAVELSKDEEISEVHQEAEKQVLLTYNDFAVHCFLKGCYEEAVLLLNKAIKGEKNELGLYINRGDCFVKLGQLNFAMADYMQALELRPQDLGLRQRVAWLYSQIGLQDLKKKQYLQAESRFSCAIENNPQEMKYYLCRAKSRMFLREAVGVKEDMISALILDPNNSEAKTLALNMFPGESIDTLLNSKAGEVARSLLKRNLKAFPEALERLKIDGSTQVADSTVKTEGAQKVEMAKDKEKESEMVKLRKRIAFCQQTYDKVNRELKDVREKKPVLESETPRLDSHPCPHPKENPEESPRWQKFKEGACHV